MFDLPSCLYCLCISVLSLYPVCCVLCSYVSLKFVLLWMAVVECLVLVGSVLCFLLFMFCLLCYVGLKIVVPFGLLCLLCRFVSV